ncbi:MAG: hypothetical protein LBG19_09225 [Prevotellaceae bacterium]|jgi:hypothetical protein|nr:hypothetical protein [Prevotellaceae bacterium]
MKKFDFKKFENYKLFSTEKKQVIGGYNPTPPPCVEECPHHNSADRWVCVGVCLSYIDPNFPHQYYYLCGI